MNEKGMKNIVVLKNVNSNIVEEAIVIIKPRVNIKAMKCLEGKSNYQDSNEELNKDYVLNEAQNVISNYISSMEQKNGRNYLKIEKKCKKLKIVNIFLIALLVINIVFKFI